MASLGYSLQDRFQPSAKLLDKTASSGFSYLSSRPSRKHLPAARSLSNQTGYNSLPRQRQRSSEDAPTSLTHARRRLVNSAIQDYLKSLNAMTRSIVLETETVEKENQCNWKKMDSAKKDDLVNNHFMPADVRMQYEHERAASCCSFRSSWSADRDSMCFSQQYPQCHGPSQGLQVMESRPTHLSQPEEWEEYESSGNRQLSRSQKDLVYGRDQEWTSTASDREELSLSQPSLVDYHQQQQQQQQEIAQPSNFNRLHKKQLSFRPSHKQHAVKPRQPPPVKYTPFRTQLGSDGESPRTSDEDYEGAFPAQNPLGFQRSKLRSYSMRSRRGGAGGIRNTANLRSSVRTSNRVRKESDSSTSAESAPPTTFNQHCRPSHYHTYSTTSTETDFDESIDLPDEGLMLDHVSRKSSMEDTDIDDDYEPQETPKYCRNRRSFRNTTLEQSQTSTGHPTYRDNDTDSTTPFSSSNAFLSVPSSSGTNRSHPGPGLFRPASPDSLDMDSVSMAPSDISKYPMDDEESVVTDQSRMTPDSVLSLSSSYSCRPRSKTSELAVLRNRRGKRGGSHIRVATSDFADRHTQFKNNMLQKHQLDSCQTSASNTRAVSPASSVSSNCHTHQHHAHQQDINGFLKAPPTLSYTVSKHDSVAESSTSDLPSSPDQLSMLSSPPATPLAVSYTSQLRKSLGGAHPEHRESGYISCSSESFQVAGRR